MILKSFFSALKMYSRIPCPNVEWNDKNRRYAFCFFPVIGLATAILFVLWQQLCARLMIDGLLQGAVMMLIPLTVTGGFHMDGFCDVHDALSSCAPREKKLQIMHDPNVGAFALIHAGAYLILQTACYAQLASADITLVVCLGFVLSRALSGLCAIRLHAAGGNGSLQTFVVSSDRRVTLIVLGIMSAAAAAGMLAADLTAGALSLASSALCVVHYRNLCYREFGGITGDCAGWFLQNCELAIAVVCAAVQIIL